MAASVVASILVKISLHGSISWEHPMSNDHQATTILTGDVVGAADDEALN